MTILPHSTFWYKLSVPAGMQTAQAHTPWRGLWWLTHPLNSAGILPPPHLHHFIALLCMWPQAVHLNLAHFKVKWCSEQNLTSNNHPITIVHSSVQKKKKSAGTLPVLTPSSYSPRKIPGCFINCSQDGDGRNWMCFFPPSLLSTLPQPLNSFSLHKQAVKAERLLNFLWLTQAKNLRHLPNGHQVKTTSFQSLKLCIYTEYTILYVFTYNYRLSRK